MAIELEVTAGHQLGGVKSLSGGTATGTPCRPIRHHGRHQLCQGAGEGSAVGRGHQRAGEAGLDHLGDGDHGLVNWGLDPKIFAKASKMRDPIT